MESHRTSLFPSAGGCNNTLELSSARKLIRHGTLEVLLGAGCTGSAWHVPKQVFRVNSIFSTHSLGTVIHLTSCGNDGNPLEILIPNASHCRPVSNPYRLCVFFCTMKHSNITC